MRAYLKGVIVALSLLCAGVLVSPSAQVQIQRGFSTAYNLTVQNLALFADGTAAAPSIAATSSPTTGIYWASANDLRVSLGGTSTYTFQPTFLGLLNDGARIGFGSTTDVILTRDAANTLALRNGADTQEFRIGPASAYLSLAKGAAGSVIRTVDANTLSLGTNNTSRWQISTAGHIESLADNTYDIGGSANAVRDFYLDGRVNYGGVLFAALGTPANGQTVYCTDCTPNVSPCTGAGTGAIAKRLNAAWDCR